MCLFLKSYLLSLFAKLCIQCLAICNENERPVTCLHSYLSISVLPTKQVVKVKVVTRQLHPSLKKKKIPEFKWGLTVKRFVITTRWQCGQRKTILTQSMKPASSCCASGKLLQGKQSVRCILNACWDIVAALNRLKSGLHLVSPYASMQMK